MRLVVVFRTFEVGSESFKAANIKEAICGFPVEADSGVDDNENENSASDKSKLRMITFDFKHSKMC